MLKYIPQLLLSVASPTSGFYKEFLLLATIAAMSHHPTGFSPILPYELEQKIFELATLLHPESATSFMLVAVRTHHWIASIRYAIAYYLPTEPAIHPGGANIQKHSVSYYGKYVKHLLVGGELSVNGLETMLTSCPNLSEFALWGQHSEHEGRNIMEGLGGISLKKLCMDLTSLSMEDFTGPVFVNITHLDVTALGTTWSEWVVLTHVPRLSHLLVNTEVANDILTGLLQYCLRLRILIVSRNDHAWQGLQEVVITDPRLVMMTPLRYILADWTQAALGKGDIWEWAEVISSAKQRGLFKEQRLLSTWFGPETWASQLRDVCGLTEEWLPLDPDRLLEPIVSAALDMLVNKITSVSSAFFPDTHCICHCTTYGRYDH